MYQKGYLDIFKEQNILDLSINGIKNLDLLVTQMQIFLEMFMTRNLLRNIK
jgi:hypothetical protein